jgi:hypothetical protein
MSMPDAFAMNTLLEPATRAALAELFEHRRADGQQQALWVDSLGHLPFPDRLYWRVSGVGYETGVVTCDLASMKGVSDVIGVDPSSIGSMRDRERATRLSRSGSLKKPLATPFLSRRQQGM